MRLKQLVQFLRLAVNVTVPNNIANGQLEDATPVMANFNALASAINTNLQPSLVQDFRLSLTSGVPVTTADVTGAATVYLTGYRGNAMALYDPVALTWNSVLIPDSAIPIAALLANTIYDVFVSISAGVVTISTVAWASDTARATALARQNGVYVMSGTPGNRYIGSFRTILAGQTEDSLLNRYVWNYYNRIPRAMRKQTATSNWNYSTNTIRQANGDAANQLNYLVGVSEDAVVSNVQHSAKSTTVNDAVLALVGPDTTSTIATGVLASSVQVAAANDIQTLVSSWIGYPGIGKHFLAWLELPNAVSGTVNWQGGNVNGITACVMG